MHDFLAQLGNAPNLAFGSGLARLRFLRHATPRGQFRAHLRGERVFNLFFDLERSFGALDGLARLAQVFVGQAEVAERIAFTAPVANLAGDR